MSTTITAYPLNNTLYSADDAMLLNLPITSGVYGQTGNFNITAYSNLTLTIGAGLAFMRIATAKGFTVYMNGGKDITLETANSSLPRIDRIVLRYVTASNVVELTKLTGTPASAPQAPARDTETNYDLVLYDVLVPAGATTISASNITDQRLNPNLCGLMASNVTQIDTTTIHNQVVGLIEDQSAAIQSVAYDTAYAIITDPAVIAQYKYQLTAQDKTDITNQVLASMFNVSEVGQ